MVWRNGKQTDLLSVAFSGNRKRGSSGSGQKLMFFGQHRSPLLESVDASPWSFLGGGGGLSPVPIRTRKVCSQMRKACETGHFWGQQGKSPSFTSVFAFQAVGSFIRLSTYFQTKPQLQLVIPFGRNEAIFFGSDNNVAFVLLFDFLPPAVTSFAPSIVPSQGAAPGHSSSHK